VGVMGDLAERIDTLGRGAVQVEIDGALVAETVGGGVAAGVEVGDGFVIGPAVGMFVDQPALGVVAEVGAGAGRVGDGGQAVVRGGGLARDIAVRHRAENVMVGDQVARAV